MSNVLSSAISVGVPQLTWTDIVQRVRLGDEFAAAQLTSRLTRGLQIFLLRRVGADCDDLLQETLLIVLDAITTGKITSAESLPGFARTVAERQAFRFIETAIRDRKNIDLDVMSCELVFPHTPESRRAHEERVELMTQCLRELSERDREILTRFYLDEQPEKQICAEMNITSTQFRLYKSRAKDRFGELGKKRLKRKPLAQVMIFRAAFQTA